MEKNEETNTAAEERDEWGHGPESGRFTAGHTPGPWEIETAVKGTNWELYPAQNRFPCQQPIAQGWASDIGERHQAEAEANARLIAAAPDLLAALRGVVDHGEFNQQLLNEARAAIAKAEGPTSLYRTSCQIAKAEGGGS